ncbi:KH domain-containing protein [Candidatus Shapirobacteria bacterium]|nr:KH domain-containing protein [Candidatus Shapirobacteria bacterium]
MKASSEKIEVVKQVTEELIKHLGFEAEISVEEDKENQAVRVQLESPDAALLIGFHGEALGALQLILNLIIYRKLGEWIRVVVNVGDWREKREASLRDLALSAAQKVKFSGQPAVLSSLSPADRRVIHLVLADHEDVETVSEGEGEERRLVVKPRPK